MNEKIAQIIPATDWFAVYKNEDSGRFFTMPLACWALLKSGEQVVGMDGSDMIVSCEEQANWVGYWHKDEPFRFGQLELRID